MVLTTMADLLHGEGMQIFKYNRDNSPFISVMLPELLQLSSGWIAEGRRNGEPMNLIVDLLDEPGFNAFAASVTEGDLIMINKDVFEILFDTARALVSHGIIMPEITSGETVTAYKSVGDPGLLAAGSRPWTISELADPVRDMLAYRIAQSGFIYILMHEMNHIFRGHLEYGAQTTGLALRAEVGTDRLSGPSGLEDETLEWDADLGAINHMLKMALNPITWPEDGTVKWIFNEDDGPTGTPEQGIQFGTLGPLICTLIFEASETSEWDDKAPRSHPHPLFRYATTVMNAVNVIEQAVSGPKDRLKAGLLSGLESLHESWRLTFDRHGSMVPSDDLDGFVAAHSDRIADYRETWFKLRDELNKSHRHGGFMSDLTQYPAGHQKV